MVPLIVTSGLSKRYGHSGPPIHPPWIHPAPEVRALEDLSIAVHPGEIFGFLGPNGAGKSTMIRLLLGYLHASAGAASVLGLDMDHQSLEIRRRTGYLPGGIALYDTMSGQDLLDTSATLYDRPTPSPRPSCRAARDAERRRCAAWSATTAAGMRQKIGIIQALQHDPELAILDEPTEGLDPLMQRAFYEILDELRAAGRTIFFSSHVLSEVERVCDRVAIVRHGRLVALSRTSGRCSRAAAVTSRCASRARRPRSRGSRRSAVHVRDDILRSQLEGDIGPFVAAIRDVRCHGPRSSLRASRRRSSSSTRDRRAPPSLPTLRPDGAVRPSAGGVFRMNWRAPHGPRSPDRVRRD